MCFGTHRSVKSALDWWRGPGMIPSPMSRAMRIFGRIAALSTLLLVGALVYVTWTIANPSVEILPLAEALVSADSERGRMMRDRAVDRADLEALGLHFEPQQYASYCGVASSVIALNAIGTAGTPLTQDTFFRQPASDVRGRWSTFFGGMSLGQLGELLGAHGARVEVVHVGDTTLGAFRAAARENLARSGDVVLVNYLRAAIDQKSGGHISPLAAYDEESDRFLVLDVSTYKYPSVWVKADAMFDAMNTTDSASNQSRGYVLVGRG